MGTRSDVGIAIKHEAKKNLPAKVRNFLYNESDIKISVKDGALFVFSDVKWSRDNDDVDSLYKALDKSNVDDYMVVEVCFDYPESDYGDYGHWLDNPFRLHRNVVVSLEYNDFDGGSIKNGNE